MSEAPRTPDVGQIVDHYEILEFLGKGGFGEVWKARDTRLNRFVAIKRLPESLIEDPERRERLRREAHAASSLNHPNICTIHDFAEIDGEYLLVMEYIEGKTLAEILRSGPLPVTSAIRIAAQIADALADAHRHGVIHRDIKSSNVLLTPRHQVKVLDFGLARALAPDVGTTDTTPTEARLTRAGITLGTIHYMSPEQLLGAKVDARSDLFSLGCVLYELLTAKLPFESNSIIGVSDAILHREPVPVSTIVHVPAQLDAILTRLLAKNPDNRYQSAEELHRDLSALITSETPIVRPKKPGRTAMWPMIAVVVALIVVIAAIPAYRRQQRMRWVTDIAIPEVQRLAEQDRFIEAVHLAREVQSITPNDAHLARLWPSITWPATFDSTPRGADVFVAKYGPGQPRDYVGRTPLKNVAVPRGRFYLWTFEKPGFQPAYRVGPWGPRPPIVAVLDRQGTIPPRTIHIPGGTAELTIPGLDHLDPVALDDYLIDQYEVTNAEFKAFVTAGGYQKREYWKFPVVKDGRTISFNEAMANFVDTTGRPGPATWELGDFPKGQAQYPAGGVSWYEAAAYAEFAGKRLPTIFHWNYAAGTGMSAVVVPASNFGGHGPWPVGSQRGVDSYGTNDMAGNLKEWCFNEAEPGKRYILGGAWNEPNYMFIDQDAQSVWSRSPAFGFRCMKALKGEVAKAAERAIWIPLRDYSKEKPVSDEVFNAYRSLYSYDRTPLNATIVSTDSSPESWTVQKITFDAAYGNERVPAYLFLPKNSHPPYQTIIFYPGSGAIHTDAFREGFGVLSVYADFVPRSGRALMFPIYKSTYERRDALKSDYPAPTAFYRDHVIAWAKDLRRSIDYLQTRPDIDHEKIGFLGLSWGGAIGPVMAAVEPRLKAVVLLSGGFNFQKSLPEADAINFVSRVTQPTLMLNARYDHFFPVETSQLPMYRLLGSAEPNKKYVLFDSGHAPPRLETVTQSLDWFDRYLGAVRR
jgi:formylglycine-generating enzyme required for sulfatase activity/dienelactone hydrolase/predicted Ser/Thr protein kinase